MSARDPDGDLSRWLYRELVAGGVARDKAIEIALDLRATFGGKRCYIPVPEQRAVIGRDSSGGRSNC